LIPCSVRHGRLPAAYRFMAVVRGRPSGLPGPGVNPPVCEPAHSCELSFKHSLQLWLALRQYGGPEEEDGLSNLLTLIAQRRVGNRPGRIEPRAIKRRPQAYPLLTKSRRSARIDVRKNGHAKHTKQVPFKPCLISRLSSCGEHNASGYLVGTQDGYG